MCVDNVFLKSSIFVLDLKSMLSIGNNNKDSPQVSVGLTVAHNPRRDLAHSLSKNRK